MFMFFSLDSTFEGAAVSPLAGMEDEEEEKKEEQKEEAVMRKEGQKMRDGKETRNRSRRKCSVQKLFL